MHTYTQILTPNIISFDITETHRLQRSLSAWLYSLSDNCFVSTSSFSRKHMFRSVRLCRKQRASSDSHDPAIPLQRCFDNQISLFTFPPRFSLEMDTTLYVKVHIVYSISAQYHHRFVCYFNLRQILIDNIGESSIFKGFNLYVIDFTMDN